MKRSSKKGGQLGGGDALTAQPSPAPRTTTESPAVAAPEASKQQAPEVQYLEVSHWWETVDERVLVALGVDGTIHKLTKAPTDPDGEGKEDGFWKKLGTAIEAEASSIRLKGTRLRLDVVEKAKAPAQGGFDLGNGMVAVPAEDTNTEAAAKGPGTATLSDVDLLRVRLWRARASHSREAGLALVILSALLFAGAFLTANLVFEISSVSSFVIGVGLLAYEAEPRVKLFPSTSSLVGPLKAVKSELQARQLSGAAAVFESRDGADSMTFRDGGAEYSIPPLGDGLVHAYELEIGELAKMHTEGAKVWLPRVMVEGLGLADAVKMDASGKEVTTTIEKPFVRGLCVQDFMVEGLCKVAGCPLTASVGQSLARASEGPVTHGGCVYDPKTQRAVLKDTIGQ